MPVAVCPPALGKGMASFRLVGINIAWSHRQIDSAKARRVRRQTYQSLRHVVQYNIHTYQC